MAYLSFWASCVVKSSSAINFSFLHLLNSEVPQWLKCLSRNCSDYFVAKYNNAELKQMISTSVDAIFWSKLP
ncbi:hypothetical protein Mp_2g01970 [Marchantia polymorpha subsp. ruderalis]|uniref:Uncharacterized protein n=1 Tax=Marchantia polymorpha TaxID=3197 RepID=A0A2R6W860_MARPO|nr:hypothetical protein MARPO_0130s0005 [Marchantia polymorpha]BBN00771.1 hypothetical protein Mp_2g01970 [Marchantia polymorpha subsp. ruderalis]|eukprot:PTQ30048.1 hypothetical protein MARPO_0130s0005 [Marchantia polymorpha]